MDNPYKEMVAEFSRGVALDELDAAQRDSSRCEFVLRTLFACQACNGKGTIWDTVFEQDNLCFRCEGDGF